MMTLPSTLNEIKLADLMPFSMTIDPKIVAMCSAIDVINQFVTNAIPRVLVLANIGNQPSDVTNLLAIEQRTPYYSQSLTLDARRALVSGTGKVNKIIGTKAAVKAAMQAAFGSGQVQEWFEYSGQPGCFRILVNNISTTSLQMNEINRAIVATKRASSHLDEFLVSADMSNNGTSSAVVSSAIQTENEMVHPPDPITLAEKYSDMIISSALQSQNEMLQPPNPITLLQRPVEMIISQAIFSVIR